jgi:hypothetical protein
MRKLCTEHWCIHVNILKVMELFVMPDRLNAVKACSLILSSFVK